MPAPLLVARPRLHARLNEPASLTLACAPLGFGKTTLVAQWSRTRQDAGDTVMWLRVRPGAGDETTFWTNLLQVAADAGLPLPPGVGNDLALDVCDRLERAVHASKAAVLTVDRADV